MHLSLYIFNPPLVHGIRRRVCQAAVRVPIGKPDSEFCKKWPPPLRNPEKSSNFVAEKI